MSDASNPLVCPRYHSIESSIRVILLGNHDGMNTSKQSAARSQVRRRDNHQPKTGATIR